jgi:oligoendopeptidase F
MRKITISNEEMKKISEAEVIEFPKYVPQIINLANQNAQGTRAKVVGQLSDLLPLFLKESEDTSIEAWEKWYLEKYPNAIEDATKKISNQIENLKVAIKSIDEEIIRKWVKDLVVIKTYTGLNLQEIILRKIAEVEECNYRLATPEEESKGIDGFVGEKAYSIKPDSYDYKKMLNEVIEVTMIKYSKSKTGLKIIIEE